MEVTDLMEMAATGQALLQEAAVETGPSPPLTVTGGARRAALQASLLPF